jgi:hypothetical protein
MATVSAGIQDEEFSVAGAVALGLATGSAARAPRNPAAAMNVATISETSGVGIVDARGRQVDDERMRMFVISRE